MKNDKKQFNTKKVTGNFIRICPACGYSFRAYDPVTTKKIKNCPMCGYKIVEPDIFPHNLKEFDDKKI